jgi:hypothetical protein
VKTRILPIAVSLFLVASCSSSDDVGSTADDTVVVDDSVESVTDESTDSAVAEFVVTVGENAGADTVFSVVAGTEVRLVLVNPDEDDEFHLHGYDLGGAMTPAGEEAIIQFTASDTGEFAVESHMTGDVLMVLVVE